MVSVYLLCMRLLYACYVNWVCGGKLHTVLPVRAMTVITPNGQNLHIDQRAAGRAQLCHTVQEAELGSVSS